MNFNKIGLAVLVMFCAGALWLLTRPAAAPPEPSALSSPLPSAASIALKMGGRKVAMRLDDYGKLKQGAPSYYEVEPTSPASVAALVKLAHENGISIRTRGRGHSQNGSSLPGENEILLRTAKLRGFQPGGPQAVTVGAGVSTYALNKWLNRYGYELPVFNDGGSGPSVGGYIAAGGMGAGAADYGGFWENVRNVTLVDGTGRLRTFTPQDAEFPWLFGSMGQLGIFVEATLDVLPIEGFVKELPPVATIPEASEYDAQELQALQAPNSLPPVYWFTLFVAPSQLEEARKALAGLQKKYGTLLNYRPGYTYPMKFRAFNPPLLYPGTGDFVGVGIWGEAPGGTNPAAGLADLDRELTALSAKSGYRRYVQAELAAGAGLELYFGEKILGEFTALKAKLDPAGILNPGLLATTRTKED